MTIKLNDRLKSLIQNDGPLDLATYMQLCLTDPDDGYYTTKKPIGRKGDFITAPEISQLFGELIGIWIIDTWQKLGAPSPFSLIEAGPGHGTLMADILRTIAKLSTPCSKAAHVRLIEISPPLKKIQKDKLSAFDTPLTWHESTEDIGDDAFILIANEFFDALPINQYQFVEGQWAERAIGLSPENTLTWGLKPSKFNTTLNPKPNDIFETSVSAQKRVVDLSKRIKTQNGAALLIDYGHLKSGFGDTFQAIKNHAYVNPLEDPGSADLTAHVDFDPFQQIAAKAGLHAKTTTQGAFLLAMGLLERAGALGANLTTRQQEKIKTDVERLAAPDKMGNLFKVMTITRSGITPHGF